MDTAQNKLDVKIRVNDVIRTNREKNINKQIQILRETYIRVEGQLIDGLEFNRQKDFYNAMKVSWNLRYYEGVNSRAFMEIIRIAKTVKSTEDRETLKPVITKCSETLRGLIEQIVGYRMIVHTFAEGANERVVL